ncbi:PilZ domain-containing protein [Magnetococcales bacterium HHB-1]
MHKKKQGSERRHFSRVHFNHLITFTDQNDVKYKGAFNDISLKGMLFFAPELPEAGSKLTGILQLGQYEVKILGQVVRCIEERGAAIKFLDMDVESFSHLRRLMALNAGDPDRIDREFFSSL